MGNSTVGVRPNSPPQMTSVSSSIPRCLRSLRKRGDRPVALAGELAVARSRCRRGCPRAGRRRARPGRSGPRARGAGGRSGAAGPGRRARTGRGSTAGSWLTSKASAGLGLHPEGQLERLDPRLERRPRCGAARGARGSARISRSSWARWAVGPTERLLDVLDQLLDVGVLAVDVGPLVDPRAGTPTASSAPRRSA